MEVRGSMIGADYGIDGTSELPDQGEADCQARYSVPYLTVIYPLIISFLDRSTSRVSHSPYTHRPTVGEILSPRRSKRCQTDNISNQCLGNRSSVSINPSRISGISIRYKVHAIACPTPVHPPTIPRSPSRITFRLTGIMDSFSAFLFRCNGKSGGNDKGPNQKTKREKDR